MSEFMNSAHAVLRWSHVVLGFAGLAVFWVVAAMPKGTRPHLWCGRTFAWIAMYVGGSAALSSLWAVVHVDSFAPWLARLSDPQAAKVRELFGFFFLLLLFLGMATLTGAVFGAAVMRHRNRHEALRRTALPLFEVLTGIASAWLAGYGICKLCGLGAPRVELPWAIFQIPAILGALGVWSTVMDLRFIYGPDPGGREWLYKHVEQMFGTGTAFHTAFAVFGFGRITGIQFDGPLALVPWVVAPVVGIAATQSYVRALRRRNGDLSFAEKRAAC